MRRIGFVFGSDEWYAGVRDRSVRSLRRVIPDADVRVFDLAGGKVEVQSWRLGIPLSPELADLDVAVWVDSDTEFRSRDILDDVAALPDGGWWIAGVPDLPTSVSKVFSRIGSIAWDDIRRTLGYGGGHDYLNSGVLAFNLRAIDRAVWRARSRDASLVMGRRPNIPFFDQTAIHLMSVPQARLPMRCNAMTLDRRGTAGPPSVVHYAGNRSALGAAQVREAAEAAETIRRNPPEPAADPVGALSMTTHGERTPLVGRVLPFLARDAAACGAAACLTVHRADAGLIRREDREFMDRAGVRLLVAERDLGPALKFAEAAKAFAGKPVCVCDDDCVYPEGDLARLFAAWRERPGDVAARVARVMRWASPGVPDAPFGSFEIANGFGRREAVRITDAIPEGVYGAVIPPAALADPGMTEETALLNLHNDDVTLRLLALRAGAGTWIVPSRGRHDVDFYGRFCKRVPECRTYWDTALWSRFNGSKGGTDRCIARNAAELWAGRDL